MSAFQIDTGSEDEDASHGTACANALMAFVGCLTSIQLNDYVHID